MNVEVCSTERALLGFVMARLQKLDPDVLVVSGTLRCFQTCTPKQELTQALFYFQCTVVKTQSFETRSFCVIRFFSICFEKIDKWE